MKLFIVGMSYQQNIYSGGDTGEFYDVILHHLSNWGQKNYPLVFVPRN